MLLELVGTDSRTDNHDGVNALGRTIERHLMVSGLRVSAFVTGVSGQHLLARTRTREGNRLLLLGHLDTVQGPDEGRRTGIDPENDERLLGPGITDMKGGLVVMLAAVRVLAELDLLADRALTIVCTADEEQGSRSGHDVVAMEAAEQHLTLVFETGSPIAAGRSTFVTERKGFGRATLHVEGREAHAGVKKEEGVSAALEMAHKVIALEALNDPAKGISVNVGVARAGTAGNVVPGRAQLEIDWRFRSAEDGEDLEERIHAICTRVDTGSTTGAGKPKLRYEPGPRALPMPRSEAVARMAERIRRAGADLGLELEEEFRGGGSDGNVAAAAGCPVVDGLGTVGAEIHSDREWMERRSLVDRAALLAVTMLRFWKL